MGAAAELFVKVSADVKGLDAGMKGAAKAAEDLGKSASQAAVPIERLSGSMSALGGVAVGAGIVAAGVAMGAVGKQAVKLAGELEQNQVAFTTMLGSADKADKMLRDLASFAASTPFELRGLTDSSKKLLAFGFSAESVIPVMNSIGNAVAAVGGGKDVLDGVTMALGQMAAKGKVSAEEMNQLAERGIPAWKMLADGIGVSIPEAMKKAEKGSIDAGTAITALVNGMNQKFPGMMQKQSQTIMGALSNLQDSADAALTKVGQKLIETFNLTKLVQGMSVAISNLTAAFTTGGLLGVLDKAFGPTSKAAILGLAGALTVAMIPAIKATTVGLIGMVTAAAPFVALAGAIAFAAYPIIKNWDAIKGTVVALWDTAAQYTSAYYNRAVRIVNDLVKNWQIGFNYIGSAIRSVLGDDLTNKLLGGLGKVQQAFRGFSTIDILPLAGTRALVSQAAANFTETWSGAMSMAKGFTNDLFRQASGSAVDFNKTVTREMLGFAKANQAATDTAKKGHSGAAAEARKHAAEVKNAAAEAKHLADATARGYERFELMARALGDVERAIAAVDAKKLQLGRSFDEAGAKAEAIKGVIGQLKSAFGQFSPMVLQLEANMRRYEAASKNGGAASAEAYSIIKDGADQLDQARHKAGLLGETWSEAGEQIKQFQNDLDQLYQKGIKPGNAIYDEHKKKLDNVIESQKKIPPTTEEIQKVFTDLTSSFAAVITGLAGIAEGLGFGVPESVRTMATAVYQGVQTMMGLISAFDSASKAITAFNSLMSTNPWLVAAGVAAAVLVGIGTAIYENFRKTEDEIKKRMASIEQSIEGSIVSALREGAMAFISGASNYADIMRQKLRDGILQGVLQALISEDIIKQFKDLTAQIRDAYLSGNMEGFEALARQLEQRASGVLDGLTPVLARVSSGLREIAPEAAQTLTKAADEARATAAAREASRKVTAADINPAGVAAIQKAIEIALNEGTEASRARAEELLRQLRIMQDREKVYRLQPLPGMALGGLVTGPTVARMGEGGRDEAVLPLNENVYRQIGQGIASARGGGTETQVVVQYYGSGKWTREDAQGLGRLLVSELRAMGVR